MENDGRLTVAVIVGIFAPMVICGAMCALLGF
jgi:hypothetical protein